MKEQVVFLKSTFVFFKWVVLQPVVTLFELNTQFSNILDEKKVMRLFLVMILEGFKGHLFLPFLRLQSYSLWLRVLFLMLIDQGKKH